MSDTKNYWVIENNVIVNVVVATPEFANENPTWEEQTDPLVIQGYYREDENGPWIFGEPPPPIEPAPTVITMAQCRLALFDLENIKTDEDFFDLVNILPEEDRSRALLELRTRPSVEINHPLVQAAALVKGWDLNQMFIYASKL